MRIPTYDVYWGEFVASESRLGILGNVKGKRILEIGCGAAQNSIALAKWGAQVCGIDLSRRQILYGKELSKGDMVQVGLIVGDMERLPFKDETFDIVTTAISLLYAPDLNATVAEVNRVLARDGCFTFSATHPIADGGRLIRVRGKSAVAVTNYFKRRILHWVDKLPDGSRVRMHSYYRTLQDYFGALAENGFVVERYVELERLQRKALHALDLDDLKKRRNARQLYRFMKEVPYWFVLKARKEASWFKCRNAPTDSA